MLQMSRSAIRLRHYSPRTEEAYVGWIRRFVTFHHKRHPRDMGDLEVRRFLTDLAEKQSVSASTQNQALNALVFLYREVLRSPLGKMESLVSESIDISERETCRESVMLANKHREACRPQERPRSPKLDTAPSWRLMRMATVLTVSEAHADGSCW